MRGWENLKAVQRVRTPGSPHYRTPVGQLLRSQPCHLTRRVQIQSRTLEPGHSLGRFTGLA